MAAPKLQGSEVVFDSIIDAVFGKALASMINPQLKTRLAAVGLDLSKKPMPAYTRDTWDLILKVCAEELFPRMPLSQALFEIGKRSTLGMTQGFIGTAIGPIVRLIGPHRSLERTKQNFRFGNNYTEAKVLKKEGNSVELWMNEPSHRPGRHFMQGCLHGGLEFAGARGPKVDIIKEDSEGTTFRVQWQG